MTDENRDKQLELLRRACMIANVNVVTCGSCGNTFLHELKSMKEQETLTCPWCDHESDVSDMPDLIR